MICRVSYIERAMIDARSLEKNYDAALIPATEKGGPKGIYSEPMPI
jgi:hypothetical protein